MAAGISVRFGVTKDELTPAMKKQREQLGLTSREMGRLNNSTREQGKTALKWLLSSQTNTQKLKRIQDSLNAAVKAGVATRQEADQALKSARTKLENKVSLTEQLGTQLKGVLGSYLSIQAAIGLARQGLQEIVALEQNRQAITRSAIESERDFRLMNVGQQEREVQEVEQLGARFGFGGTREERRQLFDVAQGLQGAFGAQEAEDRPLLESALLGKQLGLQLDTTRELLIQAKAQRTDGKQFLAQVFAAGQLSGRKPEDLARGVQALNFFQDKKLGIAIGSLLTDIFNDEARTFIKGAGISFISEADTDALGLKKTASQKEILTALVDRFGGITDASELIRGLRSVGISEIRRQQAVGQILSNFDVIQERLAKLETVQPSFLEDLFAEFLKEDPKSASDFVSRQKEATQLLKRVSAGAASRRLGLQQLGESVEASRPFLSGLISPRFAPETESAGQVRPFIGAAFLLDPITQISTLLRTIAVAQRESANALNAIAPNAETTAGSSKKTAANTTQTPTRAPARIPAATETQ